MPVIIKYFSDTSCADHFEIYTNIESLCCVPDTNTCQLDLNLKTKKCYCRSSEGKEIVFICIVFEKARAAEL